MSDKRILTLDGGRWRRVSITVLSVLGAGCGPGVGELPPVKTPLGVHLPCQPPTPWPLPVLPLAPPLGSSCGLPRLECGQVRPLRLRIDEQGQIMAAYVLGQRSPELDECLLAEVRARGWAFQPARGCNGDPLPGEFAAEGSIICDPAF